MFTKIKNYKINYSKLKNKIKHPNFFILNKFLLKLNLNKKYIENVEGYLFIIEKEEDFNCIWEYADNYYNINNIPYKEVIVDVGANIGDFSIFMSKKAKQIYSFEPLPDVYKKFKKNIRLNNIKNIKTYNFAISNDDGILRMTNPDNSVISKLDDKGELKVKTISWNTLNKITPKKIDLLKIDIEGGEYLLINQPQILKKVREIKIEFHINNNNEKRKCLKLIKIFKENKFKIPKNIFQKINSLEHNNKTIEATFIKYKK